MVTLDLRTSSGAASPVRRITSQALFDTRNVLRNGENLLLTLVIPVAVLVIGLKTPLDGDRDASEVLIGAIGLGVLATAFTSQAISTGFDRRYGVLCMLGLSPLGERGLLAARTIVSLLIITLQAAVLGILTWMLAGWTSTDGAQIAQSVVGVLLSVWAFTAWALFVAGALRAEATLAVSNAVFLLLMFGGGLAVPSESLPWDSVAEWLPTGALVQAMSVDPVAWIPLCVLVGWALAGTVLATRYFRWES